MTARRAVAPDGSAPTSAVHDRRLRSADPPLHDLEALRVRVAVLRAEHGLHDDDPLLDDSEGPTPDKGPDWAEVEQVISGLRHRASPAAKRIAVQRLTRRGLSAREIGQRIGMTERSVVRYRARGAT